MEYFKIFFLLGIIAKRYSPYKGRNTEFVEDVY